MKKGLLFIVAIATVLAGSLQADTIVQTNVFSGTPSYNRTLTFNKFDDNGGYWTLDSVNVYVYLTTLPGASLQIDNDSETIASGTVSLGANGTLTSVDY